MKHIMKRIFYTLLVLSAGLIGCNNELDINAPWQDVSIVYGMLDEQSDTNWVRIHRGYLGTEGIAGGSQQPDSLYYQNISVYMEELDKNDNVINTFQLTQDNSKDLDTGFFTTQGFHLYRLDQKVNQANSYRLIIEKPNNEGPQISATTPVVADFNITRPIGQQKVSFGLNGQDFDWQQAKYARIYQSYLRFYYVEINALDASDSVRTYVDYKLSNVFGTTLDGSGQDISNNVKYEQFYRFLFNAIGPKENVKRFFRGMDVYVVAGADDLATYISVSQPAEGIVQDKPLFTNVTNGIGIFSSTGTAEKLAMRLSNPSIDSLIKGIYTCDLMFGKASQADTCFCLVPGKFICN